MPADEIVARARALAGTRFRAQGRRQSEGLDCIGLVAIALGLDGVRDDYALRGGSATALSAGLIGAGLRPVAQVAPGDVLVIRAGPGQLHLGIWTGTGLIHADAGLRRVVERPGEVPWPIVSAWRRPAAPVP